LRLPASTPLAAWLLPSADVAILLALFALFVPAARTWLWLSCALLLCVRLGRIADGICLRYLDREFHLAADAPLVPEFFRLALSALGPLRFALALVALLLSLAASWFALRWCLERLTRALAERRSGDRFLIAAGVLALLGPLLGPGGSFYSASVSPRLVNELERWLTVVGWLDDPGRAEHRKQFAQRFDAGQSQLRDAAAQLAVNAARPSVDVHVLLIEAYGRTVQSSPLYLERLAPGYKAFEEAVAAAGFSVCTDFVRATILGGNSWLTHATLQSGVAIHGQLDYEALLEHQEIVSLANAFRAAGYRSVSVKPGTTRSAPKLRVYGFEQEYTALDLDYHGPAFAWAPMPDQFVMQRVAERELRVPTRPLFIEYALVSSHFPFNPRPPYVEDWASLGDGKLFEQLPKLDYDSAKFGWFAQPLGYLDSLSYDLRVLAKFLADHVHGDALVLILGDHQPIAPVAAEDRSRFTPLHVLSRRPALLQPFAANGCLQGMLGPKAESALTMEELGAKVLRLIASPAGQR
jgi:hypothetical protein